MLASDEAPSGFVLHRRRGEGSFAVVYEATHADFPEPVAVKLWRAPLSSRQLARFQHECRLHDALADCERVVRLLRTHAIDGERPWTVLELYDESLDERLARLPALTPAQKLVIADDVLAALEAVHAAGYLHRDVKPANVLLRGERAALSDLGMAMELDGRTADRAAGSAYYLAPELTGGGSEPTILSDVFSAAVTLRRLFGADTRAPLEALITRAASFLPEDRPSTATEFRTRLAATVPGPDQVEPPAASPVSVPRGRAKRRRILLGVVAAALVVSGALVYVFGPVDGLWSRPVGTDQTTSQVIFRDDFQGDRKWPTGAQTGGRSGYTADGYDLQVTQDTTQLYLEAPFAGRAAKESVEATGYLVKGQGAWGVWCRGAGRGQLYAFHLTHGGAAEIRTPTGTTGFRPIPGLDIYHPTRLRADCMDLSSGGVDLTLSIDDVPVLHRTETTAPILGPGASGVEVWAFPDVEGELAHARVTSFRVSRVS